MSEDFLIRAATVHDVGLILSLIRELAAYEKLLHEVTATEDDLRHNLFGQQAIAEAVLAYEADQAVGFALFFANFSTFLGKPGLYLEDLYVKSDYRGKGYGKKLLTHVAHLAHSRGCGRLDWSVLDWNAPSIKFYQSLGAKPMSEWTGFRLTGAALQKLSHLSV